MNKYDFKNIIKRIIVGVAIAFLVMSIKQCNVDAMVRKESFTPTMDAYTWSGTLSSGGSASKTFTYSTPLQNTNHYDYLLIRFREFDFTYQWNYQNDYYACSHYNIGHGYVQNQFVDTELTCDIWQYNNANILEEGSVTITATIRQNAEISNSCYLSDNMKGFLICEMPDSASSIEINIRQRGYNQVRYNIDFFARQYFYNEESTEIVNGLKGVEQQQQQVVDNITDTNISGANSSTNNALNGIDNTVSNTLDTSISANQLNTILSNFTNQLSTSTCTPISLPFPFTNETIVLPCLGTEFSQRIPVIWALYELIITGVIVLRFWQHGVEFVLNVLDPYHIGANNIPNGGGK